ncbi:glucose-6-phosphate isomerase prokaryote [Lucifera butyrica]|uniref:glucose-6-phosphate isomerase n=1 Tax=Lucifera butyrica TaxID=1351585 RepID=A0A498QZ04_9FIRM|nr:glucose-6-phosphate isomerase family protein [Lucifera butyrica]VBB05426.1 glucose-6-phosphate isomerase prokaryote [Lucifera butyrica]
MNEKIEAGFFTVFNRQENILENYDHYEERKLSDMHRYFAAEDIRQQMALANNEVIYRVYKKTAPLIAGELEQAVTVINPGQVNGEFFMTKGHYHINEKCSEVFFTLKGEGLLLLQKGQETKWLEMKPDVITYIPAGWGHRTINTSLSEPFVFIAFWPANAGHNYQKSLDEPFGRRVFFYNGSYIVSKVL